MFTRTLRGTRKMWVCAVRGGDVDTFKRAQQTHAILLCTVCELQESTRQSLLKECYRTCTNSEHARFWGGGVGNRATVAAMRNCTFGRIRDVRWTSHCALHRTLLHNFAIKKHINAKRGANKRCHNTSHFFRAPPQNTMYHAHNSSPIGRSVPLSSSLGGIAPSAQTRTYSPPRSCSPHRKEEDIPAPTMYVVVTNASRLYRSYTSSGIEERRPPSGDLWALKARTSALCGATEEWSTTNIGREHSDEVRPD